MPETSPSSKKFRPTIVLVLVLVALVASVLIRFFTRDTVQVRVSPVTHENLVSQISTNGKVEPIVIFQPHAPGPGVVEKVYVQEGQKVQQGQLLLRMDDSEQALRLATATTGLRNAEESARVVDQGGSQEDRINNKADLDHAKVQQQEAASSLRTLQQLQAKGAASAAEINTAEQRLADATSSLATIQQRSGAKFSVGDRQRMAAAVSEAKASVQAAEVAYGKVSIRAPFSGTVYSVPVSDYDFVPGGEDLLELADLNKIHVRAYFDEPEIGKLAAGQPVKIVWDAKPNRVWHGHVEVAPTTVITYGTRNVGECLITVDDADGELLPNTNVTVTVTYSQRFNVLSVPREALHTEGGMNYVFRVVNHHLLRTPVQIGALNLTRVEITSGLSERDTVALSATSNRDLTNGLEVQATE